MFTEELAREIGIAYGCYKAICSTNGKKPMDECEFTSLCTKSIEEIRANHGLVSENSVTG